jgi:hypothetical protein
VTAQLILSHHRNNIYRTELIVTSHSVMFFMLLLLFVAEYFFYHFATQKYGHQYTQTVILSGVLNVCEASAPTLGGRGRGREGERET